MLPMCMYLCEQYTLCAYVCICVCKRTYSPRAPDLIECMCGSKHSLTECMCGCEHSLTECMCGCEHSLTAPRALSALHLPSTRMHHHLHKTIFHHCVICAHPTRLPCAIPCLNTTMPCQVPEHRHAMSGA